MNAKSNHVDVKALWGKLWNHWWVFLLVWIGTAVLVGGATYLLPRKWQCQMKVVPEYNLQETLAFQRIFDEMGVDMRISATGDAITPNTYADVITDCLFLQELSQKQVTDITGKQQTIVDLYPKSLNEGLLLARMREDITCKLSRKDASIVISVTAKDPVIAQQMTNMVCDQLSAYLSAYRLEKAQRNLDYYAQLSNQGQVAATMYEIAKVREQEHQPMFIILQHAELPYYPIFPKRAMIVGIFLLLVTLGLIVFYWREDIPEWL